jgi:hypothetical protein
MKVASSLSDLNHGNDSGKRKLAAMLRVRTWLRIADACTECTEKEDKMKSAKAA